ncbi:DNA polymerase III subunit delta' C-terminal domain-containing protein [Legionella yabuuchiae]|uniref:DNA polymerase III subunit delta' C-terminal domain-containing protein n=1 Tax=Legionella yabuuchiae TaxID=376727 RepID=UPI001056B788|nr:DNA polymerase III subunit delta' C-terminal domain-containing protein [Legionella yabuuchiae]
MVEHFAAHDRLWRSFQPMLASQRIPQSMLFVGPRHINASMFVLRVITCLFCEQSDGCGHCHQCQRLHENVHPDLHYISREAVDKPIKIDQIRSIQADVYQTPKRAKYRVVVIDSADRMNLAAANALLKVLEEPPSHTIFILIAEQINSIPATILSRCQKYCFSDEIQTDPFDFFSLSKLYSAKDPRAVIFENNDKLIHSLSDLLEGKSSPPTIAAEWSAYNFDDLLWWLYLVNAQMIRFHVYDSFQKSKHSNKLLLQLSQQIPVFKLFDYNEKISALRKKLHQNITLNQTLALEDLLLDYIRNI